MKKIIQLLQNPDIGIDAWYDSYLEDASELFRASINQGKMEECFELFNNLSKKEQVKFLEAITDIDDVALIPGLFGILSDTSDIELAEPIIDGLRCWNLEERDLAQLKTCASEYYGKSELLDKVIDSFINQ